PGAPTSSNTATAGTVTVAFSNGSQINEYDVKAAVVPGAVTVLNEPTSGNTYGSVPVGDNAGAFARGFTTGPDATAVAFNSTAGTATITFDQRIAATGAGGAPSALGNLVLLDQDGTPIPSATATNVTAFPGPAGP